MIKNKLASNNTASTLKWFLDVGHHYGTMTESQARAIARVNRTTFERWMNGVTNAPPATLELLRLHAFGEPPSGFSKAWRGFRFQNDKLITEDMRELTPSDLKAVFFYKQMVSDYLRLKNQPEAAFYANLNASIQ